MGTKRVSAEKKGGGRGVLKAPVLVGRRACRRQAFVRVGQLWGCSLGGLREITYAEGHRAAA